MITNKINGYKWLQITLMLVAKRIFYISEDSFFYLRRHFLFYSHEKFFLQKCPKEQPILSEINDLTKQYDTIRKTATGQADGCTTECLLDYQ